MATEVGTLLISMQTDLARLRKDMDEAKGITGRAMGEMERSIGAVKNAMGLIGVGVTAGGLIAFARQAVDAADNMAKLSQRVGIGTADLAKWQFVADLSGSSVESLGKGVKGLSTFMKEHGDRARAVGIDQLDANKAMLQLADIVSALPNDMMKSALASEVLGAKVGPELIPAFNLGSKGIAELQAKAADYAKRLEELAPHAEAFNDALRELGLQSQITAVNIGNMLVPGLAGLIQMLNDLAAGGDRAKTAMQFLDDGPWWMKAWANINRAMVPSEQTALRMERYGLAKRIMPPSDPAAQAAAPYNPWGSDAEFMARTQAGILLGPPAGGVKGKESEATRRLHQLMTEQSRRLAEINAVAGDEQLVSVDSVSRQYASKEVDALDKLRARYVDLADPLQKYRVQLDEVNKLRALGLLSADQAINAEWEIGEAMDQAARKMEGFADTGKDAFADLTYAIQGWGREFTDELTDRVLYGKGQFRDLANSIIRDITRIQIQKSITDPLIKAGTGVLDGLFSGGLGSLGSIFGGGGGGVGSQGFGAAGDAGTLLGFAGGGSFMVGGNGGTDSQLVAFRASPNERVTVQTPGQQGGGGVIVQVIESPGQGGQVRQRQEGGQNIVEVLVDRVKSSMAADIVRGTGIVPGALSSAYGLNRVAGSY